MFEKGINNPRWAGGKSEYPNHCQLKKNRILVLKAANYVCQHCGGKATMTHHIDGKKDNHEPGNLEAVCSSCNLGVLHQKHSINIKEIKEIASLVGCHHKTVYKHLAKKPKAKKFGDAIDKAIHQRKRKGINGSQNKQISL